MRNLLDNYLLELILMDSFVSTSARCIPQAESIIQSYLPAGLYEQIIERYDELSSTGAVDDDLLPLLWQKRAVRQNSAWKRMMIERCLQILCAGGCCDTLGLAEVAILARNMAAEQECRQAFARLAFAPPAPPHPLPVP